MAKLNIRRQASHIGICGRSGTGKSEYLSRYFLGSRHTRVLIYDHQNEFGQRCRGKVKTVTSLEGMIKAVERNRIIAYDPVDEYRGKLEDGLLDFCTLAWDLGERVHDAGGETLVVCDELHKLVNVAVAPVEVKTLPQCGRKWGIDTAFASQQPNRLPNELREQWTEIVAFQLIDPRSHQMLDDLGFPIDGIDTLPKLHYRWRNQATGEVRNGTIRF